MRPGDLAGSRLFSADQLAACIYCMRKFALLIGESTLSTTKRINHRKEKRNEKIL
jgi:hypothetical protein